jgi:hypothetical protein
MKRWTRREIRSVSISGARFRAHVLAFGGNMRKGIIIIGIAFAVTLSAFIGNRLSSEALAVVVGAVCGLSASVPVMLGLVIAMSRGWGANEPYWQVRDLPRQVGYDYASNRFSLQQPQPPVVIFAPPPPAQAPYGLSQSPYLIPPGASSAGTPREFKIIGED